jgi:phage N-6-adenine-methyltransferase
MSARKATPDLIGGIDIMGDVLAAKPADVSWNGKEFDYPIDRIIVGKRMRPLGDVATLVESISQIGLLNPINILPDGTLIAGNHRVAAAKALGWITIRARVVELSEVDAELAEIDENLRRNNLTVLEESEHLLRREELLEAKGLRAKPGDNQYNGGGEMVAPPPTATTASIAGEMGMSERSAQMRLQIARGLDTEVRDRIRGTDYANSTTQLVEIARQPVERQRTIADLLMSGQASSVNEAVRIISPPAPVVVKKEYWTPEPPTPATNELPAWAKDQKLVGDVTEIKYLSDVEAIIVEWHQGGACDIFQRPQASLISEIVDTCKFRNFTISPDMAGAALQNARNLIVSDKRAEMKAKQEPPPLRWADKYEVAAIIYDMSERSGYDLWPEDEDWLIGQIISAAKTRDLGVNDSILLHEALEDARNEVMTERKRNNRLERAREAAERIDAERRDAEERLTQDAPAMPATNEKLLVDWTEEDWAAYAAQKTSPAPDAATIADILNPVPVSQRDDYDGDEWYTPADYIEAARKVMGSIDLDPASCDLAQTVVQADVYLTKAENGLHMQWIRDNVWLNPPYSNPALWVEKAIAWHRSGRQAVILVNNATETEWFQSLLKFYPVCFPERRIAFWRHDQKGVTARQGQAIFYLGHNVDAFIAEFSWFGPIMQRRR